MPAAIKPANENTRLTALCQLKQWQAYRNEPIYSNAILADGIYVIEDTRFDEDVADLACSLDDFAMVFYAGIPLKNSTACNVASIEVVNKGWKLYSSSGVYGCRAII